MTTIRATTTKGPLAATSIEDLAAQLEQLQPSAVTVNSCDVDVVGLVRGAFDRSEDERGEEWETGSSAVAWARAIEAALS